MDAYHDLVTGGARAFDEVLDLVGRLEHEQLDFKRESADVKPTVAAMSMTAGGLVLVGVSDDRTYHGAELHQRNLDRLRQSSDDLAVSIEISEVLTDRGPLVAIGVPEIRGRIVTTPDGRLLRRVGSSNTPLVGDHLARFVAERTGVPGEDEPLVAPGQTVFDLAALNDVRKSENRPPVGTDDIPRALVDLGVALPDVPPIGPRVLTAAAILFAEDPTATVAGARVQAIRREGIGPEGGPVRERTEIRGPLRRTVDEVLSFVRRNTTRYEVVSGAYRTEITEYPETAVREAVLNALAHRDYRLAGATVDLTIWDDRLELRSPGPLPGHITDRNIREEHYSRNPRIMRVLKTLRLVEEYGEGVDRMIDEMTARLMDPPTFTSTDVSVTVTLWNRTPLSVDDQAWLGTLADLRMTTAERTALVIARNEGAVTPRRMRDHGTDDDPSSVLRSMVSRNLLEQQGERGGTKYGLSDEIRMRSGSASIVAEQRRRDLLVSEIQRRGSLSTAEAARFLGDDDRARTRQTLNELCDRGLARPVGNTRARRYHAT